MEFVRIVRLHTRVSLIVQLRDAAAGGPPVGPVPAVRLAGVPKQPYAKPDGSFVFSDLNPGDYRLEIDSFYYFRIDQAVSVAAGQIHVVVPIVLTPLPSYPFRAGDTLLRMIIKDASGRPSEGASVTAAVLSEEASPFRLAQDEAATGSMELSVSPGTVRIGPGDRFTLKARGASSGETVEAAASDTYKNITLTAPLRHTYPRGSLLLPVFTSAANDRGEAVVFCHGCRSKTFQAELALSSKDGRLSSARTVTMTEGQTLELGPITLE